jgi:hypothetical protein
MDWNDDDFHSFDDYSEEEKEEFERQQKEEDERVRNHPLVKQAIEICHTSRALIASIRDDRERQMYEHVVLESSFILGPKLSGALHSGSWLLSMQNAAIIRYHAEYLLTTTSGLKTLDSVDKRHVQLLRDEMIHFRELFVDWCRELREMEKDDYEDEWGLFVRED